MIGIAKVMVEMKNESQTWVPRMVQHECEEETILEVQENLRLDSTYFFFNAEKKKNSFLSSSFKGL